MVTTSELIRTMQAAAGSYKPPLPSSPSLLRHPNDMNATFQMQRAVVELNESFRPTNTSKAHQPKVAEFFQFCEDVYSMDPYKFHLTFEKVYRFMYYQAFRPLKARGGKRKYHNGSPSAVPLARGKRKKKGRRPVIIDEPQEDNNEDDANEAEEETFEHFDKDMYDLVMAQYSGAPESPGSPVALPAQAMKPISWSTFDQYKQVLKKIHREEQLQGASSLVWEQIWKSPLDDLAKHVKGRVPHVRRITYQEKVSPTF